MFQSNQVVGPYDREELAEEGGFSAESLVCPEGRKGTQMGDWQRAGVVAELAEVLLRKAKVPAGMAGSPALDPGASLIPPEPTLRDLAVLGTLQEKVSLLENSLNQMQDELRQRDEEITGLKVQLDEKGQEASQLGEKVSDLESKFETSSSDLKDELGKTKDEVAHENELIEGLKGQLDSVRSDIQESLSKLEENQTQLRDELQGGLKSAAAAAPALAPEGDAQAPTSFAIPGTEAEGETEAPPLGLPDVVPAEDVPLEAPPSLGAGEIGELPPPPGEAGSLSEVAPPELEGGIPDAELPPAPGDELGAPEAMDLPPAPDMGGELPPPPGLEMPGLEAENMEPMPALEPEDPPPVTLDAPPDLTPPELAPPELAPPMEAPAMTMDATPTLEPLDTPIPGQEASLPITQTGMAPPEPLVPPPSMATPAPGGDQIAEPDLVDLSAAGAPDAAPVKKKGGFFRKLMILTMLLVITAGGLFQGYQMGVLKPHLDPLLKKAKPMLKPIYLQVKPMLEPHLQKLGLLPKEPSPEATLKDPTDRAQSQPDAVKTPVVDEMDDRTQDAIDFAKNWPVGTNGKTLAMILRNSASSRGRLEPWNAEQKSEGRYQVNFYSRPGSSPDYQFLVMLDAGEIRGLTAKSKEALTGRISKSKPAPALTTQKPRKPSAKRRRRGGASLRKGRRKPRKELNDDGSLTDPLGQMLLDSSIGRSPISNNDPEEAAEEPKAKKTRKPRGRRRRKTTPVPEIESANPFDDDDEGDSGKSQEELTLDELLLPGGP
ncbi:MAG: hypothetical protein COB53_01085 [Elusimicrobia bacterium]|nr:MAG: hypothetical protein COB53_01085 [Elusimicrobiota bacterium]